MLIVLGALAVAAAQPTANPPISNTQDDPIICTKSPVGSEVGTHMRSKKVCMKKSDRDFIEHETRSTLRSINNNGNDRIRFIPTPRG